MLKSNFFKSLFEISIRFIDDAVPKEDLERFLIAGVNRVGKTIQAKPKSFIQEAILEFQLTYKACTELKLPISKFYLEPDETSPPSNVRSNFQDWSDSLPDGKIVGRNGVVPGSGDNLLLWIDQSPEDERLKKLMERLLRHIEVKRKNSLGLNPFGNSQDTWLEIHAVSTAFSAYARRSKDIRFLNAVFKLNDWAYPKHKRLPVNRQLIRYLWAIAESEKSARELLA